ncbi:AAA family ATPase [Kutzneria chonburiensis]|uniref:ATP/GTP-binding protein n=1 Tax=Kutzneria chonburiensis TaxID=1483604 RepID=A0ABV6MVX4_9PSEU|nr:ATP-binding protein [Kutzneria chonburiensis]
MLLRFRTANHRSLRDEVELSLVSQPRKGESKPTSALPETVRVAGIYGANASGKSNILDAMGFLAKAVANSYSGWSPTGGVPRVPFLLDPASRLASSLYEIDFVFQGVRHTYGFEVDDQRVRAEWLYSYPTGSRKRTLFERDGDTFRFGRTLTGSNSVIAGLVRPNSLFLSVAAANSHPLLIELFRWVERFKPTSEFGSETFDRVVAAISANMVGSNAQFDAWIKVADLGVDRVYFEADGKISEADSPEAIVDHFKNGKIKFTHVTPGYGPVDFSFEGESAGTRMWLALAGYVIPRIALGLVVMVDEVDSSLHPKLSAALIQMFKDPLINKNGAQLLFTSHDVSLLGNLIDDEILDRDEVWFTEKDRAGATSLFPLTDFQPRRGENFERAYLQGRYGAVPYVDIDELRGLFSDQAAG